MANNIPNDILTQYYVHSRNDPKESSKYGNHFLFFTPKSPGIYSWSYIKTLKTKCFWKCAPWK